jgi:hypothetical protein
MPGDAVAFVASMVSKRLAKLARLAEMPRCCVGLNIDGDVRGVNAIRTRENLATL